MKSLFSAILAISLLFPLGTNALSDAQNNALISGFQKLPALEGKSSMSVSGKIFSYSSKLSTLEDSIVIQDKNTTKNVKWPWSLLDPQDRSKAKACIFREEKLSPCEQDYKILRVSPSGRYVELVGTMYELKRWVMIDTKTEKIVLSFMNTIPDLVWADNETRIVFVSSTAAPIGWRAPENGLYVTRVGSFPNYDKVADLPNNIRPRVRLVNGIAVLYYIDSKKQSVVQAYRLRDGKRLLEIIK